MLRGKTQSKIIGLVDAEEERESQLGSGRGRSHAKTSSALATMPRGKVSSTSGVKGSKVSKPASAAASSSVRRGSGRIAAIRQAAEREALADKTNHLETRKPATGKGGKLAAMVAADDSIMTEGDSDMPDYKQPAPAAKPQVKARGRPQKSVKAASAALSERDVSDGEHDKMLDEPQPPRATTKSSRRAGSVQPRWREAQEPDDVDMVDLDDEMAEDVEEGAVRPKKPATGARRAAAVAPSAVDSAAESESTLRRRLGEATLKCESLEAKYRDLREIGVKEAERNFDRLRKQGEERASGKFTDPYSEGP